MPLHPRVARYRRLSMLASAPALLVLLALGLLPVVRRYTVVNRGSETIYVTPLIHFSGEGEGAGAAAASGAGAEDPARVAQFSVLPQYSTYQFPAWPAAQEAELPVPAGGERVLFVDYEGLRQEDGAQVLVVRRASGPAGYLEADFWERTVVEPSAHFPAATSAMQAAVARRVGSYGWLGTAGLAAIACLFPLLWLWSWLTSRKTGQ
ncbi:hypothetical protein ACFST9_03105 [Hymenobacter monticola]|uniref:DUF3592 domain-containing protein n=1 Tax=Hymenobacter monticola TaxID=1705399 RepID=A0ABY4B1M1_9BACT|nr:hypothetical protein [Hymenobacter monticola]UOE33051.1 hypothetical protein MTP16_18220 [Hymenobacter monticola]